MTLATGGSLDFAVRTEMHLLHMQAAEDSKVKSRCCTKYAIYGNRLDSLSFMHLAKQPCFLHGDGRSLSLKKIIRARYESDHYGGMIEQGLNVMEIGMAQGGLGGWPLVWIQHQQTVKKFMTCLL